VKWEQVLPRLHRWVCLKGQAGSLNHSGEYQIIFFNQPFQRYTMKMSYAQSILCVHVCDCPWLMLHCGCPVTFTAACSRTSLCCGKSHFLKTSSIACCIPTNPLSLLLTGTDPTCPRSDLHICNISCHLVGETFVIGVIMGLSKTALDK